MSKYRNQKTAVYGKVFDSKLEAERYLILRDAEKRGQIQYLQMQVPFEIIPACTVHGRHFRKCEYRADFVYVSHGKLVVEDTKGFETEVFRLKEKLMADRHKIAIRKVKQPNDPVGYEGVKG